VALFACPGIIQSYVAGTNKPSGGTEAGILYGGSWSLLKWQFLAALFIILWDGIWTFIILKVISIFLPLREPDDVLELGDSALHGHEVYPADVATLGSFGSTVPAVG
jgi:Amt family ammonium transporter